jgi:hypothetical protein
MRIKIEWEPKYPTGKATVRLWWLGHLDDTKKGEVSVTPTDSGWKWRYRQHENGPFETDEEAKRDIQQWFTDREPPLP